ncbi:MAG: DUF475 domain-containing protein [Moraxellaceae bacterium]|nr:DUF475 domain-containing protein [Pseudobdellovibrionaceae bacterium]
MGMLKYFKSSIWITVAGLLLVVGMIWYQTQSMAQVMQALMTTVLLSILEISLSFDNAVVNATVMKTMSEVWKKRFLTWGMLIAVFGMRLLFPLGIVSVLGKIGPIEALMMSINEPIKYAEIMTSSHIYVASFGGIFLFMVFVHFFFDQEKEVHWIHFVEKPMAQFGQFKGVELVLTLIVLILFAGMFDNIEEKYAFLISGVFGIITFLFVHGISAFLESKDVVSDAQTVVASAGVGTFLYLEVLDASFSFDGVVGAFALTNSLFLIMIGLGIGAFFVRSLTIYFVDKNTVDNFKYLEHGAFYALGSLAIIMLFGSFVHIPEWITGLSGLTILSVSVLHSLKADKKV